MMKFGLITFYTAIILTTNSCEGQNKKTQSLQKQTEIMNEENPYEKLSQKDKIALLKKSMLDYMEVAEPSYTKTDVEECLKILEEYISELSTSTSKDAGMNIVKNSIKKLNRLNDKCNSGLIETSERELIAEIMIFESVKKGYSKPNEDITEELREW